MHAIRLVHLTAGRDFVTTASRSIYNVLCPKSVTGALSGTLRWQLPHSHGRVDAEPTNENPQDHFSRLPSMYHQKDNTGTQNMGASGEDLGLLHASKALATNSCVGLAAVLAVAGISPTSIATHMSPTCVTSPMALKLPALQASPLAVHVTTLPPPHPACSPFPTTIPLAGNTTAGPQLTPSSNRSNPGTHVPARTDTTALQPTTPTLTNPRNRSPKPTPNPTTPNYLPADTSYLPARLLRYIPASLDDYRDGVQQALYEHRLHATLYVSAAAWPRMGPSILATIGSEGKGPHGRVRFAVVPLGPDYTTRAQAAACLTHRPPPSESSSIVGIQGPDAEDVETMASERFGLDVALACLAASDRFRVRVLRGCPALVVRERAPAGGKGAVRSEVYGAWCMRQRLDEHVRRNVSWFEAV